MKEVNNLRKEIDTIDNELMDLLNKRFKITQKIGKEKIKNNKPIENIERENDILSKTYDYEEQIALEKCFKSIISISKEQQNLNSFLLIKILVILFHQLFINYWEMIIIKRLKIQLLKNL